MRKLAVIVAALALTATVGPARADITKCQQGIEKNGTKLQSSILKALGKCKDGYRKAIAKGDPLSGTAATCGLGLGKAIDFQGNPVAAMNKTMAGLQKLTAPPAACTDDDLGDLGHLRTDLFGDRWARLILLQALKSAYELQAVLVGDFPNIMIELGDAGGCPLCTALATPPCLTAACNVNGSGAVTKLFGADIPVALDGVTLTAGCEWQNILPNELGFLGSANIGLKPALVGGFTVCNLNYRSEGVYSCAGSTAPRVNYSLCQDSDLSDGDECEAGATTCADDPDATTGGACATFTTSAAAQGNTFVVTTTRLRVSTAVGGDGVACTPDDTYTATAPGIIPVTTGMATASVLDYNNTNGNTQTQGPVTGTPGPACPTVRSGVSVPLSLVGAFPGADTAGSPLQDTVTKLTLTCVP